MPDRILADPAELEIGLPIVPVAGTAVGLVRPRHDPRRTRDCHLDLEQAPRILRTDRDRIAAIHHEERQRPRPRIRQIHGLQLAGQLHTVLRDGHSGRDPRRIERQVHRHRRLHHPAPHPLGPPSLPLPLFQLVLGPADPHPHRIAGLAGRQQDRQPHGGRKTILLLGLGLALGPPRLLVVLVLDAQLLILGGILRIAPALRRQKAGQIPPRRRKPQHLLAALGIERPDEVRLQGTDQLLAKLGGAARHEDRLSFRV